MNGISPKGRPLVSVILAVYNEASHIKACLASLLGQETPDFELEILAIDGKSTDGTKEILDQIASSESRVRVLVNEKRKTPFAFNLGLRVARGKYVCIFGSHSIYKRDYISVCLKELTAHGAVGCSGRVITQPSNDTLQSRLVTWALSHPFGSSRKSFRTQAEGFVDIVNFPIMVKDALIEVGGYDEELIRNQDNDMNQRLRARGHKLFCTWKTSCLYSAKSSIREFLAYASRNGFWNAVSLKRNSAAMGVRHFVPFLFLLSLLFSLALAVGAMFVSSPRAILGALPLVALLGAYFTAGLIASLQVAIREKTLAPLWLPFVFLGFHVAYGLGTLAAFISNVRFSVFSPPRLMTAKR